MARLTSEVMALIRQLHGEEFRKGEKNYRLILKVDRLSQVEVWAVLSTSHFKQSAHTPMRAATKDNLGSTKSKVARSKYYWAYQGKVFETTDPDLTADDVLALVNESANRRRLQLEKAHALQAMTAELDNSPRRKPIPQDVRVTVWQRDGGRCVECGSNEELEFDHIIPLAMGGANTLRNLQLLCRPCNRRKGASLG